MSESEPKRPSVLVDTPMQAAGGSQVSHAAQGTPHSLPGLLPDDEADSDLLLGSENSSALDRHIHSIRVQPIQDISLPFTTGDSVSDAVLAPFEPKETPCFYILNVVWLSICFSLVEGSILVVLAFETSINHDLGVYSSAALYIAFTVGAIPAPLVLHILRPKYSLVAGLSLYCLYIGANMVPHWGTLMPAGILAGLGGTFLWTAQGSYITYCARRYARLKAAGGSGSIDDRSALGFFNGIFTGISSFIVVMGQASSSLVLHYTGNSNGASLQASSTASSVMFIIFSAVAIAATVGMCFVADINISETYHAISRDSDSDTITPIGVKSARCGSRLPSTQVMKHMFLSALRMATDWRILLLIPSNMSFGFVQGFQNSYWATDIVGNAIGVSNIGYVGCVAAGASSLAALPLGWISDKKGFGRPVVMVIGFLAHFMMCIVLLTWEVPTDTNDSVTWFGLLMVAMLFGLGNVVWNGAGNSAVFGDYFHATPVPAFANLKMWSGMATAISYFLFPVLSPHSQLILVSCFLGTGICGYAGANWLQKRVYER